MIKNGKWIWNISKVNKHQWNKSVNLSYSSQILHIKNLNKCLTLLSWFLVKRKIPKNKKEKFHNIYYKEIGIISAHRVSEKKVFTIYAMGV